MMLIDVANAGEQETCDRVLHVQHTVSVGQLDVNLVSHIPRLQ